MRKHILSAAVAATITGTATITPQFASAQGATVLEEIVVTARKKEENLLEVPELAAPRLGSWLTDAAEG